MQAGGQVLVMEQCDTDLAQALAATHARMDEALVKALTQQLLAGVQACHAAGAAPAQSLPHGPHQRCICVLHHPNLHSVECGRGHSLNVNRKVERVGSAQGTCTGTSSPRTCC